MAGASVYKGLTIRFGGDTTELQKALRDVSTESKKTQSDLKEINKSLKFNPGNTELLEQKVKNLNKAYGETKTKLDVYKQALSQLEEKKQRGEQLTEEEQRQYDSLQRSILQCENQLESYEKDLQSTTKEAEASKTGLYQLGQQLEDNAEKMGKAGEKMEKVGTVTTATFGGIAAAAYGAFSSVEEAENIAVKGAGAVGDAADEIRRSVRDVAASAPGDLETVGQAVGDVNTHFQVTGDRLDEISGAFLEFSKVTGGDVSSSVENVAMSMKAFNVDADQTELVLDHLASTSTATGVSVDTLTSLVNANGSTFREMGLSLDDSITLLGNFEAAGVPTSDMLTALKKATANCAKEGTDLGTVLNQLVDDLQDPAKEAEATQQAFDLFGSKAAVSFIDAAQSGRVNLGDLNGDMSDSAGFVSDLCDETMSSSDQMQEAWKNVQLAGAELGEQFAPILEDVAGIIKDLTEWVRNLSPEQKELFSQVVIGGVAFGGLTTAVGKVLQVGGTLGGTFKTLATGLQGLKGDSGGLAEMFTGKLSGGWSSFTGLISAHPIGLGVAAVAAAVAGLTWFFTQTETGKQMWSDFTSFLQGAWQGVCDFLGGIPEWWQGVWDTVSSALQSAVDFVSSNVVQPVVDCFTGLGDSVGSIWDGITSTVSGAVSAISSTVQSVIGALSSWWSSTLNAISSVASSVWNAIKGVISGVVNGIKSTVTSVFNGIKSTITNVFNGIKSVATTVWNAIKSAITTPIEAARDTVRNVIDRIRGFFNFSWSLPKLKLPHLSITGGFSLMPPSVPHFSIEWYKQGGIFTKPTVFDTRRGPIGLGEAGAEAVLPIERISDLMADAMRQAGLAGSGSTQTVNVAVSVDAVLRGEDDAYRTGRQIGAGIASKLKQRGVSVAYA